MKPRLRVPRVVAVIVIASGAITAGAGAGCEDDDECVRCVRDPTFIGDAGIEDAPPCPVCLPKDGVCGPGCIPEGFT